jgi:hypothetical protein
MTTGLGTTIHYPPAELNVSFATPAQQPLTANQAESTEGNISGVNGDSSDGPRRTRRNKRPTSDVPLPSVPSKRKNDNMDSPSHTKRAKVSADPTMAAGTPGAPPSASEEPKWFYEVSDVLQSENLGEKWNQLVSEWRKFERKQQFVEVKRLSPKGRPDVVRKWITRGRKVHCKPEIDDLDAFEAKYKAWWVSLQPDWRVVDGVVVNTSVEGEWGCLRLSGANGLLNVLGALFIWGFNVRAQSVRRRKVWSSAVDDCFYVISRILR